jgi:large repetitive protein
MKIRAIIKAASGIILTMVLSTGCRHHKEVVYVNNTPPPPTTVVYNNTPPPNNTVIYNNQPPPPQPVAPAVSITYPATNFTSAGNYITVQGNIQNIQSAHQISVSQNGYPIRYFAYDPYTGNFHFQTFLQQGTNNLIITANSSYGTGSQGVTVFFNPSAYVSNNGGYNNGGNYPNNSININANVAPNGVGNYPNNSINPNANVAPNGVGNYPNNSINPNANVAPNGGGNYPNNSINPNANIAPNGGGNYPNNSINPNANIAPNGGGNYPNNSVNPNNPNNNLSPHFQGGNAIPVGGAPMVQYINPSSSPVNVTSTSYNVVASIQNVTNASQITVSVNGSTLSSFNFIASNHSLTFTTTNLLTGFNSIHITATNGIGTASQSTVIDYKPVGMPPRIQIFNPATSPFSSLQPNMIVSGYVYNVTSSSEISASFNGNPISFSYNSSTQEIDIPVNLIGSTNQLIIKANNPAGNDSKQINLALVSKNCSPTNISTLQTSGVIQPNTNNNNSNNNTPPHTGQQNPNLQTGGNNIYIDQNTSNSNNSPHVGQQNPNLQTAGGAIYIDQHPNANSGGGTANGLAGTHHQPEITRTSPASTPYTTMSGVISAAANVNFVTSTSEVSVTYNGSSVSFSYNPQVSEALNFTSPLSPGMNTFIIKATNSYGTASQNIDVNYVPTNTSGNVNGNPGVHFEGGRNVATNTPKEFNTNNNQNNQRTEPPKNNPPPKPVQQNNTKEQKKK